jgi:phage tail sheath protein FI
VPNYLSPGVYVEEVESGVRPITAVGSSTAAFVGPAPDPAAHLDEPIAVSNWTRFLARFAGGDGAPSTALSHAVHGYFLNGGSRCYVVNTGGDGGNGSARGLAALEAIDEIAIVCAPGVTDPAGYDAVITHCEQLRDRVAILDPPSALADVEPLTRAGEITADAVSSGGLRPRSSPFAALYYPRIVVRDPVSGEPVAVAPSGHVAGMWARTDSLRGVHKPPANEVLRGAVGVEHRISDAEQEVLNPCGVNVIRSFSRDGIVVWGARTLAEAGSEYRYLNVRRLVNVINESIIEGTRWAVFEPNDATLWRSLGRDITAFLTQLWRDGALRGRTPEQAFFVQCDEETNPAESVDAGIVTASIGIAPVKPAEFVVFRISQHAAGSFDELVGARDG